MTTFDAPIPSLPMAAFGLAIILVLVLSLIGSTALFAWGSRISFRQAGESRKSKATNTWFRRVGWPVAFFILPGFTHVAYSFFEPTPYRFRLLAWSVSLGLLGGLLLSRLYLAAL